MSEDTKKLVLEWSESLNEIVDPGSVVAGTFAVSSAILGVKAMRDDFKQNKKLMPKGTIVSHTDKSGSRGEVVGVGPGGYSVKWANGGVKHHDPYELDIHDDNYNGTIRIRPKKTECSKPNE